MYEFGMAQSLLEIIEQEALPQRIENGSN